MFSFSRLERSVEGMYFGVDDAYEWLEAFAYDDVDRKAEAELIEVSFSDAAMAAARSGSSCSILFGCSGGFSTVFCVGTYPPRPPPPPPSPEKFVRWLLSLSDASIARRRSSSSSSAFRFGVVVFVDDSDEGVDLIAFNDAVEELPVRFFFAQSFA